MDTPTHSINCECKITEAEGTHCQTCKLQHHVSIVSNNDVTQSTTVSVRTPTSTLYPRATAGSHLPTLVGAPILPTRDNIDPPTDRRDSPSQTKIHSTFSLSSLRQSPLYLYNQKTHKISVRRDSEAEILENRFLAPIVAEFDGLFEQPNAASEPFSFKVHGTPEFIDKVNALNQKYDVFSTSVRKEPADVTSMEVKVDIAAWERPANAGPPRKQSIIKEQAILGQIVPLQASNIIQSSTQPYYSQVHMVPKVPTPTDPVDFRFCVDLRGLNNVTENTAWPLPNIPALLNRIGQQKPKLFAKLDLTSGYHQFPLHQNSWNFFAFITFMGIYEWLRCVMGGKGVGAHFQKNDGVRSPGGTDIHHPRTLFR